MATILKEEKQVTAIMYIDSINKSSYMAEMINYTLRYIREVTDCEIKNRDSYMALDSDDIYKNKKDGYWFIITPDNAKLILYKKTTSIGTIYNSIYVDVIFTLSYYECPRIVPKILTKPSLFDSFTDELKASVTNYKNRSNSCS